MSRMKSVTALALVLGLVVASMAYAQGGASTTPDTKATTTPTQAAPVKAAPAAKAKSTMKPTMAKCDVNSASKEDLMKLSGIDDATADKIIAGRPFKTKAALVSKGIMTKEAYAKISAHITTKKATAK